MITEINSYSVGIQTAKDLSDVVTVNNAYTHVYFMEDITLTGGISINPNRSLLVLDGEYPLQSGSTHQLIDPATDGTANTLNVTDPSSIKITLRNLVISGRNWYGLPSVRDDANINNVEITYEKVSYTGRQPLRNIYGTVRIIDSTIALQSMSTGAAGEAVEACTMVIGGKTTITKTNASDSVLFFRGDASKNSLTILAGADVTISTTNNYFMFADGRTVPYTIEPGASFKLSTRTGLSYGHSHRVSPFYVGENATFEYTQTAANTAVYIPGTLTVMPGARFSMRSDNAASAPLLYFISDGTYNNLQLNDPKSFVVYKQSTQAMYFEGTRPFLLSGEQVNYWAVAGDGSFANRPLYPWHNANWTNFQITGRVGYTTMSSLSSTLAPPISPALTSLTLYNARVLSVGYLPLELETPVDNHRPIKGKTDPHANLIVKYIDEGGAHEITGTAKANGKFSIPTPAPLAVGTRIEVSANVPFLYKTAKATVVAAGSITILEAPSVITFVVPPICPRPLVILGRKGDATVTVFDNRVHATMWSLMATIDGPMRAADGEQCQGAITYVRADGSFEDRDPFVQGVAKPVYTVTPPGTLPPAGMTTTCSWLSDKGILLDVVGPLRLNKEYVANIEWSIHEYEEEE